MRRFDNWIAAIMVLLLAVSARGDEPLRRVRDKLSGAVRRAIQSGQEKVRVIVRLRGASRAAAQPVSEKSAPGVLLALRREEARRSAAELLSFLETRRLALDGKTTRRKASPRAPRASSLPEEPRPLELWIANSVCVDAEVSTLNELARRADVEHVYHDVRIQAVPRPAALAAAAAAAADSWALEKLRARSVWDLHGLRGEGVVIGHIDTGVDSTHPALSGRLLRFRDFVNGRAAAYDDQGHGTHTASTICGSATGVAPGARIVVAKALDSSGSGRLSHLLQAMQWMLDPDGNPATDDRPVCVSNSWGIDRKTMSRLGVEETFFWDAVNAWRDAGILPLFASGNEGLGSQSVPAAYPNAVAVGATDRGDSAPSFSAGGTSEWGGVTYPKPDLAAPGQSIAGAAPGGGYRSLNGTSMACPHAAGVVALLAQARPDLSARQLESLLHSSAVDLGTPGRDNRFGVGRIDAMAAVSKALGVSEPGVSPPAPPSEPEPTRPGGDAVRRTVSRSVLMLVVGLAAAFGLSFLIGF